jgi:SOS-response transcriptional repressor LexA
MSPEINPGDTVIVAENACIKRGDIVLASLPLWRYTVKKLGKNELIPLNTKHKTIAMPDDTQVIGKIVRVIAIKDYL